MVFSDDFERPRLKTTGDWTTSIIDGNYDSDTSTHFATSGSRSLYICCGARYTTTCDIDLSPHSLRKSRLK